MPRVRNIVANEIVVNNADQLSQALMKQRVIPLGDETVQVVGCERR